MTDKEKIIQEIERRIHFLDGMINTDFGRGSLDTLNKVLNFINSLPAEQSEDLVDAARNIRDALYLKEGKRDEYGNPYFLPDTLIGAVIAGAHWQKEKLLNKACKWLNKNVVEYHPRKGELRPIVNINAFREAMEDEQ